MLTPELDDFIQRSEAIYKQRLAGLFGAGTSERVCSD